jgi:hypothetical protein
MAMQLVLSAIVLTAVGAAVWSRRKSWRSSVWQDTMTLALVLEGVGFILVAPWQTDLLGDLLFTVTGTAHMDDYLGHLCMLASVSAVIMAVAYRLIPKSGVERFMLRIEAPGAAAAIIMLVCILFSSNTKTQATYDFFNVPVDGWLRAYWITYGVTVVYLIGWLIRLLIILRADKRSRLTCDLFGTGCAIGLVATTAIIARVVAPGLHIPVQAVWAALSASIGFSAVAGWVSWRRNARSVSPPPRR